MMPIMEVEHVARLAQIGVDSLKIEGRAKSLYYVARTAQIYRRAIDDAVAGRPFNTELLIELEGLSNRGYTGGLLERRPSNDYQNYINGHSATQRSQFAGEVLGAEGQADVGLAGEWVQVETRNHFAVGDLLEVVHPSGNITVGWRRCATCLDRTCRWRRGIRCGCGFRWLGGTAGRCWRGWWRRRPVLLHGIL